jgi:hypothetical protein
LKILIVNQDINLNELGNNGDNQTYKEQIIGLMDQDYFNKVFGSFIKK